LPLLSAFSLLELVHSHNHLEVLQGIGQTSDSLWPSSELEWPSVGGDNDRKGGLRSAHQTLLGVVCSGAVRNVPGSRLGRLAGAEFPQHRECEACHEADGRKFQERQRTGADQKVARAKATPESRRFRRNFPNDGRIYHRR
jgi:hypothetical protein